MNNILDILRHISHSMTQAQISGNDWRREVKLSKELAERAIAELKEKNHD